MIEKLKVPLCEDDIKKHWIYTDKVYISCCCITFNQKDYIKDTINSFLAQETICKFEIIIHDDLSTDGTRDILLEYKDKYPSIIKLILQNENQYSLGKKVTPIVVSHASGEYISICEGDDFWVDKYKLQKQIVELENNQNINLVISKAISLYPDDSTDDFCDLGNERKIIPFEECILGPKKDFFPTASFFLRKKIFDKLPDWFYTDAPVGDYYIQLFAAKYNGVIYLPEATTVYRRYAVGSWSLNNNKYISDLKRRKKIIPLIIKMCDEKYYNFFQIKDCLYDITIMKINNRVLSFLSMRIIFSLIFKMKYLLIYLFKYKLLNDRGHD
ncbi:TPA: glycosyltransferase [Photobacterium damselae]